MDYAPALATTFPKASELDLITGRGKEAGWSAGTCEGRKWLARNEAEYALLVGGLRQNLRSAEGHLDYARARTDSPGTVNEYGGSCAGCASDVGPAYLAQAYYYDALGWRSKRIEYFRV
jgi:hypothetical protein